MSVGRLLLIFIVTKPLNIAKGDQSCEPRWENGHDVQLGCLQMLPRATKLKYSAAKNKCDRLNARLVEILTNEQMDFIVQKMKNKCGSDICEWWGGANKKSEGTWIWEESGNLVASFIWENGTEPTVTDTSVQYSSCFKSILDYQGSACRGYNTLLPICQRKYTII